MAQTLYPTAIVAKAGLGGLVTDIDDDPASPDANWCTSGSTSTYSGSGAGTLAASTGSGTGTSSGQWSTIPAQSLTVGVAYSLALADYDPPDTGSYAVNSGGDALPAGLSLDTSTGVISGTPTTAQTKNVAFDAVPSAEADWQSRISGAGVVWYHNFDSEAEVDQFRWTGGYSGGNDPNALGSGGTNVTHQASGGADGGGFLRINYPLGSVAGRGNSYWYRPFNAFTGAGNGRGQNDPGASGTITPVAFPVSDGSSTLYNWGNQSNPGWYMHSTHQASYPGKFQGSDFWLQARVRRAERPGPPPNTQDYSNITGKHVWFTTTNSTYSAQEIVTYGQSASEDVVGQYGRHRIYGGYNYQPFGGSQDNESVTLSNLNVGWRYSGGWDTLLYHFTPGLNSGTGTDRTRIEIWAASAGESSYTKIWDTLYTAHFDGGTNSVGAPGLPGWNSLILGAYHNGSAFTTTAFNFDYDQVIFSKESIACPAA